MLGYLGLWRWWICLMLQVSPGFVFLTGKADDQRPVPVLPDTACSQSLILSGLTVFGCWLWCECSGERYWNKGLYCIDEWFLSSSCWWLFSHQWCLFHYGGWHSLVVKFFLFQSLHCLSMITYLKTLFFLANVLTQSCLLCWPKMSVCVTHCLLLSWRRIGCTLLVIQRIVWPRSWKMSYVLLQTPCRWLINLWSAAQKGV